ncbi:MAG: hypothetical protein IJH18_02555 [Bacilli bacterium]|nr:hypothetical protein [Bacilli bacterium]
MKKIGRIKYNNKIFDIFIDDKHQKHFLEVVREETKEKYVKPDLEDLVRLTLLYNTRDPYTYYDSIVEHQQKHKLKRIIANTIGALTISATIFSLSGGILKLNKENKTLDKIINYEKVEEEDVEDLLTIEHITLDDIDLDEVSVDDVRKTLQNNVFLTEEQKEEINEFISAVEEKEENIDLRILNYNLKDIQVVEGPVDSESILGKYVIDENTLFIETKDELGDDYNEVLYHELTHVLHLSKVESKYVKGTKKENCLKEFSVLNGYGVGLEEGMNEVISNYLLSGYTNMKEYYQSEPEYVCYGDVPYTCLGLLEALDGYYSINDFLNGDVYGLESLLKKIESEDIIDRIDVAYLSFQDEVEVLEEENEMEYMQNQSLEQETNLVDEEVRRK